MFGERDRKLFEVMENCLGKYLKAAGSISQDAFDLMSMYNGLLWMEIEEQKNIIRKLLDEDNGDNEDNTSNDSNEDKNVNTTNTTNTANTASTINTATISSIGNTASNSNAGIEKATTPLGKENGPIMLYDKMVKFLMGKNCDELHWVKVYSFKCEMEDYKEFQIKYVHHKAADDQDKNYLMFGNLTRNYSIRNVENEITGDTSECFDYILNLRDKLGIDI